MGPLDELRRAINRNANTSMDALDRFTEVTRRKAHEKDIAALDAYEAAHPGLVDVTTCNARCPACANCMGEPSCIVLSERVNETVDAPIGRLCPVIERRRDAASG